MAYYGLSGALEYGMNEYAWSGFGSTGDICNGFSLDCRALIHNASVMFASLNSLR